MTAEAGSLCKRSIAGGCVILSCLAFAGAGPASASQAPPAGQPTPGQPTPGGQPSPIPMPPRPQPMPGGPARDQQRLPATGTAAIRGRVVSMEAGTPLRRVQVRVFGQPLPMGRAVMTDAEGKYEIKDLPAGRFQLTASKGGYVMLQYGQRRATDAGKPIELADGQTIDKIEFALPRGGVVVGRIVDEYGEPVTDIAVTALTYRHFNGRRRLMPVAGRVNVTNDIGQYRLHGLPPGEYYIAAGVQPGMFMMGTNVETSSGYAPTYHPGTPSVAEAQRVAVHVGDEVAIDLQLIPTRIARVSGTVVDSSGRPVTTGFVSLTSRDEMMMPTGGGGAPLKPDGSFAISGVVPGPYLLGVNASSMFLTAGPQGGEVGMLPITVSGQDLDGLRIVTSPGGVIAGRIVFEGSNPPPSANQVRLTCMAVDREVPMMGMMGAVGNDQHQFEMKGVHSACRLGAASMTPGWYLKSVLHDGQDITDRPLNLSGGKTLSDVQVVMTSKQTTLSGSVVNGQAQAIKEYVVVVFAEDKAKWEVATRYVRSGRPDQEGQFKVIGLPPGDYLAVALENLEQGGETDPELLERLRATGVRARLAEDMPQSLTLKLSSQ